MTSTDNYANVLDGIFANLVIVLEVLDWKRSRLN